MAKYQTIMVQTEGPRLGERITFWSWSGEKTEHPKFDVYPRIGDLLDDDWELVSGPNHYGSRMNWTFRKPSFTVTGEGRYKRAKKG